ncbi:hypothetical protein [Cryptosporangium japonicum]|uniref:Uncharacterized protein n=1 Tax=Cryptosporangium japonicum TaxID=80872 RepID=A0ABN0TG70_9ACTN
MQAFAGFGLLLAGTVVTLLPGRFVRAEQWQYGVVAGRRGGQVLVRAALVLVGVTLAVSGIALLVRMH